jgi:hypothetical protein
MNLLNLLGNLDFVENFKAPPAPQHRLEQGALSGAHDCLS